MNSIQALELAYGKGNLKKWALESTLIETLYKTEPKDATYLKLKNLEHLDFNEETETEYIIRFGYYWQIPRTELDLHIMKRDGQLYLTKEGSGWGYEEVEKAVLKYLFQHKGNKNLYLQTNWNGIEFLIK